MKLISSLFCCVLYGLSAQGQGTFRNTDFELAQIPQNQPNGVVSTTLALPFWTVYYGTNQLRQSPAFERWLELGKKVQKSEAGPTVAEWIGMRQKREPEYKGRTLSKWLQSGAPVPSTGDTVDDFAMARERCEIAVSAIGTNAIPWLIAWLQSTNEQYTLARRGFGILQGDAAPAIPALAQMTETNLPSLRSQAYSCLKGLSLDWTNIWPALVPVLHNADQRIRQQAASFLYQNFQKEAEKAGLRDYVGPWFYAVGQNQTKQ